MWNWPKGVIENKRKEENLERMKCAHGILTLCIVKVIYP